MEACQNVSSRESFQLFTGLHQETSVRHRHWHASAEPHGTGKRTDHGQRAAGRTDGQIPEGGTLVSKRSKPDCMSIKVATGDGMSTSNRYTETDTSTVRCVFRTFHAQYAVVNHEDQLDIQQTAVWYTLRQVRTTDF